MPDASLDIAIRTLADKHGADEVQRAIDDLAGAQKKAGVAAEEHGHKVHELEKEHRLLHTTVHQLGEEFPLLGTAIRLALSPHGAILIGLITAIQSFRKASEQAEEASKKLGEELQRSLIASDEAAQHTTETMEGLAESFIKWFEGITSKHPTILGNLEKELQVFKDMKVAQEALAKLQGREAAPPSAETAEELRRTELARLAARRQAEEATLTVQGAAARQTDQGATDRATQISTLTEEIKRLQEVMAKSGAQFGTAVQERARSEELQRQVQNQTITGSGVMELIRLSGRNLDTSATGQQFTKDKENLASARAELERLTRAREDDANATEKAKKSLEDANKQVDSLTEKADALKSRLAGQTGAEFFGGAAPGSAATTVSQGAQRLATGGTASPELLRYLQTHDALYSSVIDLLTKNANDAEWMKREIDILEKRAANNSTRTLPGAG